MNNSNYFRHDYNCREDDKIQSIIFDFGYEGYGIYWAIVEMIYNNDGEIEYNYDKISFILRVDKKVIEKIISHYNLFKIKNNRITSKRIQDDLNFRKSKSDKARKSASIRWEKNDANAMRTDKVIRCERNAIKESKVKESKVNNIIINNNTEKSEYGNPEINKILLALKKTIEIDDFKESQKIQRQYGKHFVNLLKKIGKEEFRQRLDLVLQDNFKLRNSNSIRYLYGEIKSFIKKEVQEDYSFNNL